MDKCFKFQMYMSLWFKGNNVFAPPVFFKWILPMNWKNRPTSRNNHSSWWYDYSVWYYSGCNFFLQYINSNHHHPLKSNKYSGFVRKQGTPKLNGLSSLPAFSNGLSLDKTPFSDTYTYTHTYI